MNRTYTKKRNTWLFDDSATAIAEFAIIFPILMTMVLGVYEVGSAIVINQKSIAASQMVADLITRNVTVDDADIDDIVKAAEHVLSPYEIDELGVDILSVQYDENDDPQEVWRETRNMEPREDALTRSTGLGTEGDGAVVVTVRYVYHPAFSSAVIGDVEMEEMAFARGRRTAIVSRD